MQLTLLHESMPSSYNVQIYTVEKEEGGGGGGGEKNMMNRCLDR